MFTWRAVCTTPGTRPSYSMLPVESLAAFGDEAARGHNSGRWDR